MSKEFDKKSTQKILEFAAGSATMFHIPSLEKLGIGSVGHLPNSIKILLESVLRNFDGDRISIKDLNTILKWSPRKSVNQEISFKPGRVILQDFTGVPCVVDLAALRSAMKRLGGDYKKINPQVPCDLIIDHSVQVDSFGTPESCEENIAKEFKRNKERYAFLKWGQSAFKNFRVVPPATGIIHQINLEYLAQGVLTGTLDGKNVVFPDSLIGTDSHTTMINSLGVLGWGVGGIEAEAIMLGEPLCMCLPEVIGVHLTGKLSEGGTATDLVLTIVDMLRKKGVVGKFVEFFGDGVDHLSLPDRAMISNMAPEYGATMGYFSVDKETLRYYRTTGRSAETIDLVERYMKEQGLFAEKQSKVKYTETLKLDISSIVPCLAGPKRPQDRIALSDMKRSFKAALTAPASQKGFGLQKDSKPNSVNFKNTELSHGAVAIASITSCTNTSNPTLLIGAGLLAKNAVKKGLKVKPYVKTSFAPGSRTVTEYLNNSGLMTSLDALGFNLVGYGCMTCIGNSGPLTDNLAEVIAEKNIIAASVTSGNRNFEGRISPHVKANYLASPMLVVAYALAGTVNIDLLHDPIGINGDGNDVFLKDLWPSQKEIDEIVDKTVTPEVFRSKYCNIFEGINEWKDIKTTGSDIYSWDENSTYIQEPPFFIDIKKTLDPLSDITEARALVVVGDSITTDHISPAGSIAPDSPAGKYLEKIGVLPEQFNSYGSRRGNDRVMTRGTFANIRLKNLIAPGTEGSWTTYFPQDKLMNIYDAAIAYKNDKTPLIVLAGKEYGTGSSRDWAAKGTALLGIKIVLAESFERIHRSNLVGMGVLPLEFKKGDSSSSLGLVGDEIFDFHGLSGNLKPNCDISVTAKGKDGNKKTFRVTCRLDTPTEIEYYQNGGILQAVLRKLSS